MRLVALAAVCLFGGAALLLSELRWFRRIPLFERLRPYAAGGMGRPARIGLFSAASIRDVIGPLSRTIGGRAARIVGVNEELAVRLERVHSPLDPAEYRVRQIGWSAATLGAGIVVAVGTSAPAVLALLLVVGSPILAFLVVEHRLALASGRWQRRLLLELPVIAEQLGMLLSAGYSLGGALGRIAARGEGNCAHDLRRVIRRTRQGLGEVEALREWGAVADINALDRLISVLALNREAGDLGRLIAEEARSIRRETHRDLIEAIERRNQMVWIPVTVAALVPGVILMGIPFVDALSQFSRI